MRHLICLLLLLSPLCLSAQTLSNNDVTVLVENTPFFQASHGYVGFYISVENKTDENLDVGLAPAINNVIYTGGVPEWRRDVTLGPRANAQIYIPAFTFMASPNSLHVYVNGRKLPEEIYLTGTTSYSRLMPITHRVLTTRALTLENTFEKVVRENRGTSEDYEQVVAPIQSWGSHWQDYSAADLVVLRQSEWTALERRTRSALRTYVRNGGMLLLTDAAAMEFDDLDFTLSGEIYESYLGFGRVALIATEGHLMGEARERRIVMDNFLSGHPYDFTEGYLERNASMKLVDSLTVPLREFLAILVLFALVIGPINFYILNKRGKRIYMLVTVPLISIVTTVLIMVTALFSEGITPRFLSKSLTFLDQPNNQATTLMTGGIYAPIGLKDGMHFPYAAGVRPIQPVDKMVSEVSLKESQNLKGNWFPARTPSFFLSRYTQTRREQLVVTPTDQGIRVTNGLGATLTFLKLADANGKIYESEGPIGAGETAELRLTDRIAQAEPQFRRGVFKTNWSFRLPDDLANTSTWLEPKSYLTQLEEEPFMGELIRSRHNRENTTLVLGVWE